MWPLCFDCRLLLCIGSVLCFDCGLLLCIGSVLGAGDEGPEARREAEEGAGAPVQPAGHRVPAHALRDAHG